MKNGIHSNTVKFKPVIRDKDNQSGSCRIIKTKNISIRIAKDGLYVSNEGSCVLGELKVDKDKVWEIIIEHGKKCRVVIDSTCVQYKYLNEMRKCGVEFEILGSAVITHEISGINTLIYILVHYDEVICVGNRILQEIDNDMQMQAKQKGSSIVYDINKDGQGITTVVCTGCMTEDEINAVNKGEYEQFKAVKKTIWGDTVYDVSRRFSC